MILVHTTLFPRGSPGDYQPFPLGSLYPGSTNWHTGLSKGHNNFPLVRGHLYEDNVNLYRNLVQGTTAKVQGTTAIAADVMGYFKAWAYLGEQLPQL